MSAKTRIVVLHMKEVIYTAIFVGLGIVLVILLLFMFLPKKQKGDAEPTMQYTAGVYTSSVMMGSQSADVQVIVDENFYIHGSDILKKVKCNIFILL